MLPFKDHGSILLGPIRFGSARLGAGQGQAVRSPQCSAATRAGKSYHCAVELVERLAEPTELPFPPSLTQGITREAQLALARSVITLRLSQASECCIQRGSADCFLTGAP